MSEHTDHPSLVRMAWNLTKAFAKALVHYKRTGEIAVDREEYVDRLRVCEDCPEGYFYVDKTKQLRCGHEDCGCYLEIKAGGAAEMCPIFAWLGDIEKYQEMNDG